MTAHYDNPAHITYNFGELDIGNGDIAAAIKQAPGYDACRIVEIQISVTEVFNAVTTQGFIRLGTAGDNDKFAELGLGAAAATDGYGIRDYDVGGVVTLKDAGYGGNGVIIFSQESISQIEVNFVAPVGGTPTGKGHVSIALAWWG